MGDKAQPPRGEIQLGEWLVTPEWVRAYVEAVGDSPENYLQIGVVPPLALTACVLGRVLQTLELPGGTIHSLQELETLAPLEIGSRVIGLARQDPPRRRGGLEFTTVSYTLSGHGGQLVQRGRTTVLTPAPGGSFGESPAGESQVGGGQP